MYICLLYRFSQPVASTEIWLDDLSCSSSDLTLLDCRHRGIGVENCVHSQDVALICETGTITPSDPSDSSDSSDPSDLGDPSESSDSSE